MGHTFSDRLTNLRRNSHLSFRERLKVKDHGFTMVELLITVVIIAILTAIAVPAYISVVTNAQNSAAQQTISSVIAAEDLYFSGAGKGRAAVPPGTFVNSLAALSSADLITLDAGTTARTAIAANVTDVVAVGVIAENGQGWTATTDNRTPVKFNVTGATAAAKLASLQTQLNALIV